MVTNVRSGPPLSDAQQLAEIRERRRKAWENSHATPETPDIPPPPSPASTVPAFPSSVPAIFERPTSPPPSTQTCYGKSLPETPQEENIRPPDPEVHACIAITEEQAFDVLWNLRATLKDLSLPDIPVQGLHPYTDLVHTLDACLEGEPDVTFSLLHEKLDNFAKFAAVAYGIPEINNLFETHLNNLKALCLSLEPPSSPYCSHLTPVMHSSVISGCDRLNTTISPTTALSEIHTPPPPDSQKKENIIKRFFLCIKSIFSTIVRRIASWFKRL